MRGLLANNGDPTLTHSIASSSPAIHKGANPMNLVNAQRGLGFPREMGGLTDIGALKFQNDEIFKNGFDQRRLTIQVGPEDAEASCESVVVALLSEEPFSL